MLMIAGVHLLGLACVAVLMIPALRDGPGLAAATPEVGPTTAGATTHGSRRGRRAAGRRHTAAGREPARVRLRDHRRLRDQLPAPERRPSREPDPQTARSGRSAGARRVRVRARTRRAASRRS